MKMNSKILLFTFIFFCYCGLLKAESFGPADSEVSVGDQQIVINSGLKERRGAGAFSSTQAGTYWIIRFYQIAISSQDGPNCRFHPTCSLYGRQAIIKHGMVLGILLAGDRLLRCNPYYPPGDDPVPETILSKGIQTGR